MAHKDAFAQKQHLQASTRHSEEEEDSDLSELTNYSQGANRTSNIPPVNLFQQTGPQESGSSMNRSHSTS